MFADERGLSVLCVRIGAVREGDACDFGTRDKNIWCSARDCVQMLRLMLEAPPAVHYDVFYAGSDRRGRWSHFQFFYTPLYIFYEA
jgi:hypothetical protein